MRGVQRLKKTDLTAAVSFARQNTEDDGKFIIHRNKHKKRMTEKTAPRTASSTAALTAQGALSKRKRELKSTHDREIEEDMFALAASHSSSTENIKSITDADNGDIFAMATMTPKGSLELQKPGQREASEEPQISAQRKKELDNQKRLEAIERKKKESAERRKRRLEAKNSRIIFDETVKNEEGKEDNKDPESEAEPTVKPQFLGSSDEEDSGRDDIEDVARFRSKPQFDQKGGWKLLQMQRKFGGDPRFKLDERFIDSGDDEGGEINAKSFDSGQGSVEDPGSAEEEELAASIQKERSMALNILDNLLPPPRRVRELRTEDPDKEERERSQNFWRSVPRFDPTALPEQSAGIPSSDPGENGPKKMQKKQ